MKLAIQKNWRWVATIIGLGLIAAAVSLYIFAQQGIRFPWEEETQTLFVDFENSQAVTPGQGQSVQVAGVKIGTIAAVKLEDGRARVKLAIEPQNKGLIRKDAQAMLRPRTPLKDMYVQILPGSRGAAPIKDKAVIALQNTSTDVDVDEILSTLDERTRDYLVLLTDGAAEGLKGRGGDLAQVFKRFEPTARDLRTVSEAVGREDDQLRRLVTAVADINTELAKDPQALSELVDASAATFTAFASEDDNLRESLSELPPTLRQARTTLRDIRPLARELGPASRALTPALRRLDDANKKLRPFAKAVEPTVRKEIRPFAKAARPLVSDLAPAAKALNATAPELTRSGRVLNRFFNMLASNPEGAEAANKAGREEGYLFWIAWLFHQGVNLQNIEDGNGPMRPIFLTGTCGTLTSLARDNPLAEFGLNLSPLLATQCGNPNTIPGNLLDLLDELLPNASATRKAATK